MRASAMLALFVKERHMLPAGFHYEQGAFRGSMVGVDHRSIVPKIRAV